jgi:outer membrane protein assembly factor BamB
MRWVVRNMRRALAVALLCGLAGCSGLQSTIKDWTSSDRAKDNLPAALTPFSERAAFTVRWHQSLGEIGNNPLTPAFNADAVYAANGKGELYRLSRNDGKQAWHINAGFEISGGVGAGEGLLLIGGEKGDLAAYGEDGKLRWKAKVTSEVMSAPQVSDGVVVVRTGDGRIAGLDAADGKPLWNYQRATPALIVRSHAGVAIQRNQVFAGFAGGKLVALELKSGSLQWETAVSQPRGNTELERISDVTSTPVVDDEQVCAIAFQGRLACFDIAQGNLLWSRDIAGDKGLNLLRKFLYVTDTHGGVLTLEKSSGSTVWKNEQLSFRRTSVATPLAGWLVVGDLEGYVHAMSREDGSFAARLKTDGSPILSEPV